VSPESSRGNSTVLMVGNDGHSWAVDGENYYTKHKRKEEGAKPELTNDDGQTALLLACGNTHMEAVAVLVAATKAAGAHDVVGCDGYSALMWAEMHNWVCVARSLRQPALALFRGEAGAVQVLNPSYVGADRDARD
jgi:ankyrin repeat protein